MKDAALQCLLLYIFLLHTLHVIVIVIVSSEGALYVILPYDYQPTF